MLFCAQEWYPWSLCGRNLEGRAQLLKRRLDVCQFSVTVINTWDKMKGSFWLIVLEVSVHGQLVRLHLGLW
jgi:hypothetical protein